MCWWGAECMENNLKIKECVAVPMLIFPKGVADKNGKINLSGKFMLTFIRTLYKIENGITDECGKFHAL